MTTLTFDVLAKDRASDTFGKLGKNVEKTAGKFEGFQEAAKKAGTAVVEMGKVAGVAVLGLGVAIGGGLAGSLLKALDVEAGVDKLQGQLGLTEKAAARSGDVARKVYGEAWGESLEEVNGTIRAVGTNLGDLNKISEAELTSMTRKAQILADTFDTDVNQSTRAAGQLMRTGLAKDAEMAFDLITKGFQQGANRSDDFLDTLNEYAPQFQKLGISGPYAVNLIGAAMQAGARDTDVAADAIKEFSIRSIDGSKLTAEGFKAAGLNAKTMAARIAEGGPTAEKAFRQTLTAIMSIEDPVTRDAAGVALLGTQWEDLGPTVVGAMAKAKPSIDGVTGATEKLGETVGSNTASRFETLRRKMEDWLLQIGQAVLPHLEDLAKFIEKRVMPAVQGWVDWLAGPGKYRVAESFLGMTQSGLEFAKSLTKFMAQSVRGLGDFTAAMLTSSGTAAMAMGNTGLGNTLLGAANAVKDFSRDAGRSLEGANGKVEEWNTTVDRMRKEIKLKGDIADLDLKIKRAKERLKDPKLTRPEATAIRAQIKDLVAKRQSATRELSRLKPKTVPIGADSKKARSVFASIGRYRPKAKVVPIRADTSPFWRIFNSLPRFIRVMGQADGGWAGMANGGRVNGPGTATSDSIPTMLSNGEFVVRASQARKFGGLLEAINNGRLGSPSPGVASGRYGSNTGVVHLTVVNHGVIGSRREVENMLAGALDDLARKRRLPAALMGR